MTSNTPKWLQPQTCKIKNLYLILGCNLSFLKLWLVNCETRYLKNVPKPEVAHKTGSRSNSDKLSWYVWLFGPKKPLCKVSANLWIWVSVRVIGTSDLPNLILEFRIGIKISTTTKSGIRMPIYDNEDIIWEFCRSSKSYLSGWSEIFNLIYGRPQIRVPWGRLLLVTFKIFILGRFLKF